MADRIVTSAIWHDHWFRMWLWNRDSEFTKWQHPAMWYVALGWHAIDFAKTFAILEFYIWFPFSHITITSPQSTMSCHSASVSEILSESDHPRQKKMTSCRFSRWRISAILECGDPIMGSLKSPCMTSYRSSIETISKLLSFWENCVFFAFWRQTNRQTDKQTNSTDALSCSRCRERRLSKSSVS